MPVALKVKAFVVNVEVCQWLANAFPDLVVANVVVGEGLDNPAYVVAGVDDDLVALFSKDVNGLSCACYGLISLYDGMVKIDCDDCH